MSVFGCIGLGANKIITGGAVAKGTVTEVKTCYWLKVNTKAVRTGPLDGAQFPHIIYFTYRVDGEEYKGSRFFNWNVRCPWKGETITVYYDSSAPRKYAVRT